MVMIVALIVTYNPEISFLAKQSYLIAQQVDKIIYVDNGSKDVENVKSCLILDKSIFIDNKENLGLGLAQNIGLKKAKDLNSDFVLLMDQDSLPPTHFVSSLLKTYEDSSINYDVALVGPAIRNIYKGALFNELGIKLSGWGFKRIPINTITKVDYCIASGSLIPMNALDKIGAIQEKLFIDGMDIEWCLRSKSLGYEIIQTNSTYLEHQLGNGSEDRVLSHSPIREYYIVRNDIWLSKQKYIPIGYRMRKKFTPIVRLLLSLSHLRIEYFKAEIRGLIDGVKL